MSLAEVLSQPTLEMIERFHHRMFEHVSLVQKNLAAMEGFLDLDIADLAKRGDEHDRSKFGEEEREGYIWLTWRYRCEEFGVDFVMPPSAERIVRCAMELHRSRNAHHPEAHASADSMSALDVVEMVCDWAAIAQETRKNGGSARPWAEENLRRKWDFSSAKTRMIFEVIDELDRRNRTRS